MAQTLISRVRGILSSSTDDYFKDPDLLDYVNEGYKSVVSSAVKLEMEQPEIGGRSIRALDRLRRTVDVSLTNLESFRDYYVKVTDLNAVLSGVEFEKEIYIGATYNECPLAMSEVTGSRKHKMDFGHLKPTEQRGYYEFTGASNSELKTYFHGSSDITLHLTFSIRPQPITELMTTLPDLPDRLIHAVVVRAALMAGIQEIRENRIDYLEVYKTELSEHLW